MRKSEMDRGYVKMWRKMEDWEWYKSSKTVHLFLHLIMKANHQPYNFQGHRIERGQTVVGRKALSDDLGISERNVRTIIKRLKSTSEITTKTTNKFTVISILNYEQYQGRLPSKSTSKLPINRPASDQQVTTIKECKNVRMKEYTTMFESFFKKYPKKVAKSKAFDCWKKLPLTDELYAVIMASLDRQIKSKQWQKDGGQFIPHPTTWLNGRRWEDELGRGEEETYRVPRFCISKGE